MLGPRLKLYASCLLIYILTAPARLLSFSSLSILLFSPS